MIEQTETIDSLIGNFNFDTLCRFFRQKSSHFTRGYKTPSPRQWDVIVDEKFAIYPEYGIIKQILRQADNTNVAIAVFAIEVKVDELTSRSCRQKQFILAKDCLRWLRKKGSGEERAIRQGFFVFYDKSGKLRFSLVTSAASADDVNKDYWSHYKRQTFFVEKGKTNKTFRARMELPWDSLEAIKKAFSVEALTKEFYEKLFAWYEQACKDKSVEFPNNIEADGDNQIRKNEHLIRLITRLMFVWFIKQKGLVPESLFDAEALKGILKSFKPDKGDAYYRAILQNLFFATLNSEISERAFAADGTRAENREHFDVKTLYRYRDEFAIAEKNVLALFRTIPFLNGGLFECLDRGKEYADGFSRNPKWVAHIPNRYFFDQNEETLGLIPLLSRYDFTVDENVPGDEEVALDPELLGKVFENLLATYNPETEKMARNATGSFYTPREIVNYMVDESLVAHLVNMCGEDHAEAIRKLFTEGTRPANGELGGRLDNALVTAKILDPACGSGAFPMGILLRMVELLRVLRNIPYTETLYDLKLELIENCIYGDDIQCIAVQISKLRFFISLVCEQTPTSDPDANYGINPLPNLETKFVAADSLIGLPKDGKDVLDLCTGNIAQLKTELWGIRHRHFLAKTYREKKDLRKQDKAKRDEITKAVKQASKPDKQRIEFLEKERAKVAEPKWRQLVDAKERQADMFADTLPLSGQEELMYDANEKARKDLDAAIAREKKKADIPPTVIDDIADKLASWDPYDQTKSAPFSDPEWMFNVKEGFDIVIGNPPYISVERFARTEQQKKWKKLYATFASRGDVYCFFYERAFTLVGVNGVVAFISSNKFQKSGYGKQLRQLLASHRINLLMDFCELPVFEAATDPIIVIVSKGEPSAQHRFSVVVIKDEAEFENLQHSLTTRGNLYKTEQLKTEGWSLEGGSGLALVDKLRTNGITLSEYVKGRISYGVKTGLNKAFIIDQVTRDSLIREDHKSADLIRPWIRGRDIRRWTHEYHDLYVILVRYGFHAELKRYPAILAHLSKFSKELKVRGQCKTSRSGGAEGQHHWLELDNNPSKSYLDSFAEPKIVIADIGKFLKATWSEGGHVIGNTGYILPGADKSLLALLLSSVVDWYARMTFQGLGDPWKGGRMRFINRNLVTIPIPPASSTDKAELSRLTKLAARQAESKDFIGLKDTDREIDEIVFRLFNLSPEEIAIIKTATQKFDSERQEDVDDTNTDDSVADGECEEDGDDAMK